LNIAKFSRVWNQHQGASRAIFIAAQKLDISVVVPEWLSCPSGWLANLRTVTPPELDFATTGVLVVPKHTSLPQTQQSSASATCTREGLKNASRSVLPTACIE
jgi:hypothetical protein